MKDYKDKYLKYKHKYLTIIKQRKQIGGNNILNFIFCNYPYEKEFDKDKLKIKFEEKNYTVEMIGKNIIIYHSDSDFLQIYVNINCTTSIKVIEMKNTYDLLKILMQILKIPYSWSNDQMSENSILYYNKWIEVNNEHILFDMIKETAMINYNFSLGIIEKIYEKKIYSINFIWLRTVSFSEKCFSISGHEDNYYSLNTISDFLLLENNDFFKKLINWSLHNDNSIINFWVDFQQLKIETIINLYLLFGYFNSNLKTNIYLRDVWTLKIANYMNKKYPNILEKGTGHSLIMRVDLYKCIISVEELNNCKYSVFADLDMESIGEDIILCKNNLEILNRIGLILTKLSDGMLFENGFQILGSENTFVKNKIIETFNIMLIERTMNICNKTLIIKKSNIEQLVFHLYNQMYKYLYYTLGYGMLFTNIEKIKKVEIEKDILPILDLIEETSYRYKDSKSLIYISFDLFKNKEVNNSFLQNYENIQELIDQIIKSLIKDNLCNYLTELRHYVRQTKRNVSETLLYKKCNEGNFTERNFIELLTICPVKNDDLIIFEDISILPVSKQNWPFDMYKKYTKVQK
jgi:hypothetical protein